MAISMYALAAAIAAAAVGVQPTVKWVPLNSVNRAPPKTAQAPAPVPVPLPPPTVVVAPIPGHVAPVVSTSEPVTAQVAPVPPPVVVAPSATQQPLEITCRGAGTASKVAFVGGTSTGSFSGMAGTRIVSGSTFSSSSAVIPRDRRFADQVDIRLFSGDDRIRLPRTMLPPIHGGSDGWFKLKHVVADARSIHASAAVNILNNPKVYIDRVTGTISISGKAGDYSGQCQAIDASAPAKF